MDARAPEGSSLERLSAAVAIAGDLHELGDRLLDRYVQAARADGRSWAQIGKALGVTKQAAQQRFVAPAPEAPVWPGLSETASEVMTRAAGEARVLRHRYLGTEHLLLALAADKGLAGTTLARLGVDLDSVRERVRQIIGPGHSTETATLGVTPRTKRVLEAASKEARRLGHRCADTEHLLLALSRSEGAAVEILHDLGADANDVRAQLADLLAGEAPELAAKLRSPRRRLRRSRT